MSFRHLLSLPVTAAFAGLAAFVPAAMASVGLITFLLITLAAILMSTFVLRYELHESPPVSQPLPAAMNPTGSPAPPADLPGPLTPLSYFTSFTGNLMILLLAGLIDPVGELLLGWLNVLVVPYVLLAVFYQKRPVRPWCVMYLGLPVVLAGAPLTSPDTPVVLRMLVLLVLPFLAARLQVGAYARNRDNGLQA